MLINSYALVEKSLLASRAELGYSSWQEYPRRDFSSDSHPLAVSLLLAGPLSVTLGFMKSCTRAEVQGNPVL